MKNLQYILCSLIILLFTFSACKKDEVETTYGQFSLNFDNVVGSDELVITAEADNTFPYSNQMSQTFNVQMLGYYISRIELKGPNGAYYEDEVTTGPTSDEVNGFYHVLESDISTQLVTLEKVPTGTYNQVTFTLGVEADYVQQGATGGVLDPANGGWLWNWDAGYIGWGYEGRSPESPAVAGTFNPDNSIKAHIGGWKEIAGNAAMTNNVQRITLDFPSTADVSEGGNPRAHIVMDLLKALDGHHGIDFSSTYAIHTPAAGTDIAHNLKTAFEVDHIHL